MHTVKEKLVGRRGVTIIMALVFFLIAAIVGSIVITAAAASAGRLTHLRSEQQAYLTVSSAARLARDEIAGIRCTIGETRYDPGGPIPATYSVAPAGVLSPFIQAVSVNFFTGAAMSESFQITPETGSAAAEVTATVTGITTKTAGTNYTIVISLSSDAGNPMLLSVPFSAASHMAVSNFEDPDGDGDPSDSYSVTTITTIYSFGSGTIAKGD